MQPTYEAEASEVRSETKEDLCSRSVLAALHQADFGRDLWAEKSPPAVQLLQDKKN